jgi:hypothetical protein
VYRKRPELWPNDWIRLHNNAPSYKVLSVKNFLAKNSITELEHPSCSPDLALNDCCLFPKTNSSLKGRTFQDTEDIQENVTMALKAIPQQEFQKCLHQWG